MRAALRQVLEALPLPGLMLDARGRVAYANPSLLKLTGWSRRDLQGRSWFRKISGSPEEAESDAARFQRMRDAEGGPERNLQHLVTRSGERRSVQWDHLLLGGGSERSPFCACIGEDVTDKFRVVDRLYQSERRARRIVDSLPLGVHLYYLDGEGRLMFQGANAAADLILGIPHADLVGREILEAFPSLAGTEIPRSYEDLCRFGGEWRRDEVAYEDGRIRGAYEVIAFQSEPGSVAVLFHDVTERRRSEEALRTLDLAVGQSLSAVALADPNGRITYVNDAFLGLWGYEEKEVLGRPSEAFWQEPERARKILAEVSEGRQVRGELVARRRDGARVPVEVQASPVMDPTSGRVHCIMGSFADITARKRFEEMLRGAVQGVSGEIGERFFHALAESLRKALQADCVFVGKIAREDSGRLRTLAVFTAAGEEPNFDYTLAGSPCETVLGHKPCVYREGVADLFPGDAALREMGVEGYAGIPLWDERGNPLGLLVALFRSPVPDPEGTLSILQLFASRASAEIRRQEATVALVESRERYESLVTSLDGVVYEVDLSSQTITYMSPQVEKLLGYPAARWMGDLAFWFGLIHPEDLDLVREKSSRTVGEGKPAVLEYRMRAEDGRYLWVRDSVRFMPEGEPPRIMRGLALDITREKEAELALRRSEERYRTVADYTFDWETWVDMDHVYQYVSPAVERITGYTAAELMADQEIFERMAHPEDRESVHRHIFPEFQREGPCDLEFRIRRKDGEERWIHHVCRSVQDAGGNFFGRRASNRDITDRKRAELALAENERKYRTLFEQSGDYVFVFVRGEDGVPVIYDANETALQAHGYSREELAGKPISFLDLGADPEEHRERMGAIGRGELALFQVQHRRKNGTVFDVEVRAQAVRIGDREFIVSSERDITDRRRAEEALRASEARFRTIVEYEPECVKLLDREGRILEMNPAGLAMIEADLPAVLGQQARNLVVERDRPAFDAMVEAVFRGERAHLVFGMVGLQGTPRTLESIAVPLRRGGESGPITALLGVTRDVTERIRAEAERRASEERHQSILQTALDGFWQVDFRGRLQEVNRAYCAMSGYTEAELLKMAITDLEAREDPEVTAGHIRKVLSEGQDRFESHHRRKDGSTFDVEVSVQYTPALGDRLVAFLRDITERKRQETLQKARARLSEMALTQALDDILQAAIDEAEEVTGSFIGFFHFLKPDQRTLSLQMWSTRTIGGMCTADAKGMEYDLEKAGVWVDCVRAGSPVIHNNYVALGHRKGMPEGHADVRREMVVPVFRGGAIVALLGVGNKEGDYDAEDVRCVAEIASLAWDIAERKRAQEALRASEERYRLLADNISDVIWTIDVDSRRISYTSPSIRSLRGITVEEALSEPIAEKLPDGGEDFIRVHLEDRIRRFVEGDESLRTVTHVVRQRHRDGRWLHVEMVTTLLPDEEGRVREILGVSRDVTARVQAEEESRRLAVAVEQAADGILIVGRDGRIAYANPAFLGMSGFDRESILGEPAIALASGRDEDAPALRELLEATRAEQAWQGRFWARQEGAGEFLADARAFPVRDAGGCLTQFVAFVQDVTEATALREKLRKAQELERLGRLVGGVAHEVRNPLNAILASAEALAMDLEENPEYKPLFDVIRSQLNRLSDLMRELLELGKPIPAERRSPCSLKSICQDTLGVWLQSHALLTKRPVSLDLPLGDALVKGDRNKLIQVLVNLLDNSLQCDAAGGPIRLVLEEGRERHRLRVVDVGPGIPESQLAKVFDPFFSTRKGGTGLGLTLVKHLVEQHGGEVSLRNNEGGAGCTAEVLLPAWEAGGAEGTP